MTETARSSRLVDLVADSRDIAAHSAFLIRRARALCTQSSEDRGVRRVHHGERRAWAEILAHLPSDPDRVVVLCAWCHRVRGVRRWTHLPVGIEFELRAWDRILLSHGYCPECMRMAENLIPPPAAGHGAGGANRPQRLTHVDCHHHGGRRRRWRRSRRR